MEEEHFAGQEHLDPGYVATYDRKSGFDSEAETDALRRAGTLPAATVVDLGAGTGSFALAAAPYCGRIVAVDPSQAMTALLRRRVAAVCAANVEVVLGGFLSYRHTGSPADVVYSRNALHQLPDFWKTLALARIADVLRPGGVLVLRDLVLSCEPPELDTVVESWLARASADSEHGWTAEELAQHLRQEFSTFSWLLEPMLEHAGLDIEDVEASGSRTYARYVCRRRSPKR